MTLAQGSAVVAILSAVAAAIVSILGVFERRRAFQLQKAELAGQAQHWQEELKQLPAWTLTQPDPGVFTRITSAGRTSTTGADPYLTDQQASDR